MFTCIIAALGVLSTLGLQWLSIVRQEKKWNADREDRRLELEATEAYRTGLKKDVKEQKILTGKSIRATAEAVQTSNGIKKDLMEKGVRLLTDEPIKATIVQPSESPVPVHQD